MIFIPQSFVSSHSVNTSASITPICFDLNVISSVKPYFALLLSGDIGINTLALPSIVNVSLPHPSLESNVKLLRVAIISSSS